MHLQTYLAFAEEMKLAADAAPAAEAASEAAPGFFRRLKDKFVGKATGGAKVVSRAAAEETAEVLKKHAPQIGANLGQGMAQHAPQIGASLGQGIAQHAPAVGEHMGIGLGKHLSEAGGSALDSAVRKVREYSKKPSVRATAVGLGALYAGGKLYSAGKQHQRDLRTERMTRALEDLASRREGKAATKPARRTEESKPKSLAMAAAPDATASAPTETASA